MSPVNLTRERWLRLIAEAHLAMSSGETEALGKRATAMREVPAPVSGAGLAACQALRWGCLWFAHAEASARPGLKPILLSLMAEVERVLTPLEPDPVAVAAAIPVDLFAEPEPAWAARRDIGG
ncbi:hypothetical protein D3C71_1119360 [compost metagenome]